MKNILSDLKWNTLYTAICLVLLPVVIFFSFCKPWEIGYDFWHTAATIRELSDNLVSPSNPIVSLPGNTCARFVPYTIFWAIIKKVFHIGIFTTMGFAGLANYLIFISGLHRFISKHFNDKSLTAYALITMLIVWGIGYEYANAYHLEMFLITLSYIGFFAFALSLHALFYLDSYCKDRRWPNMLMYSLLSIIAFISHPITGLFCFVAAFAILLAWRDIKLLFYMQAVPLVALAACLFWPYFNYWNAFTKGTGSEWMKYSLFSRRYQKMGLAFLGFPIVLFYAWKRKYLSVLYGILLCSIIYIFSELAKISIGGRFILYLAFLLHVSIALYLRQLDILNIRTLKNSFHSNGLIFILILTFIISCGGYRVLEMEKHFDRIFDKPYYFHAYESPVRHYLFLSTYLARSDIVMATPQDGWVIPSITGAKVVASLRTYPFLAAEGKNRRKDVKTFFDKQCSLEERKTIINKYGITYAVINSESEEHKQLLLSKALEAIGREVAKENNIVLYEVSR